ncbi:MAG: ABC transporter permease [Bacillota bacterium]
MITDILTIAWKEWKEIFSQRGRLGGVRAILIFVAVFGVFQPWQFGRSWVESPSGLAMWAWVPLFLVMGVIADSFAGERERHTLETLLASRLSDRAILLGKIAAAVGYALSVTLLSLAAGLVTVNVAHGRGEILMYSPATAGGILTVGFLGALLAAAIGVLVSLRAPTVRYAQQTLSIGMLVLVFGTAFGLQELPAEWRAGISRFLTSAGPTRVLVFALSVVALVEFVARFHP